MRRFEVVVAVNLDPPWRFAQDYLWLEILAPDERTAVRESARWVMDGPPAFEATGLVREAGVHDPEFGSDEDGIPLKVRWGVPAPDELPERAEVRDPIDGLRLGYIATDRAQRRWLSAEGRRHYRLLVRKPTDEARLVCLLPRVRHVSYARELEDHLT